MSKKVVTFGEIMLRLSTPDLSRTVQTDEHEVVFGGGEPNVALGLASMGVNSFFVSRVADNDIGQSAVNLLNRYGVETAHMVRGGDRLGLYFLEPGYSVRPSKVIYDRYNSSITGLEPGVIDWEAVFENADWFHWSGITPAIGEKPRACIEEACRVAKQSGATVSCDLNYRAKLWSEEEARNTMIPLMENVDVCIGNPWAFWKSLDYYPELADNGFFEEAFSESARDAFDFEAVAITMREDISANYNGWSAVLADQRECKTPVRSNRYEIEVVDRVGGGDSFAAALIYSLMTFNDSRKALEFATAASALKLTIIGDYNLVSEEEIQHLADGGDASASVTEY